MSVRVVHGNALDLASCGVEDDSVDLVVTSPPYFGLRSYQDGGEHYAGQIGAEATPAEFVDALVAATREMVRVLKPSGSIFVNLGDRYSQRTAMRRSSHQDGLQPGRADLAKDWKASRARGEARMPRENVTNPDTGAHVPEKSLMGLPWRYALRCIDDLGLILRAEIVWSKPNGAAEPRTDRVRRSHETWFHFVKTRRVYHSDIENACPLRGSVWTIPVASRLAVPSALAGTENTAQFPMEWPRRFIEAWCPPDGTVLDPFGGNGTTATVAHALGRDAITVDLSRDYCRVAQWRTTDPGQLARARQEPKPKTAVVKEEPDGVMTVDPEPDLFGLLDAEGGAG